MAILDAVLTFVISLLVGGLGIYVGATLITGKSDYGKAVFTALIGAIVWGIVGFLIGWLPLLGPLIVFLAYAGVIKSRYRGGWIEAFGIALVAWIASLAVMTLLAILGVGGFDVLGVPGV
jgi:hypothetical protein